MVNNFNTKPQKSDITHISISEEVDGEFQLIQSIPNTDKGYWECRGVSITLPTWLDHKAFNCMVKKYYGRVK